MYLKIVSYYEIRISVNKKNVDGLKICVIYLKYWSWSLKRMICHLQVCAPYRPADESMNEFTLIYNVDNSYASGKLDVGRFFNLQPSVKMQLSGKQ
jgi:hypothetical protein